MANPGNPGPLQRIEVGKRIGNFYTFRYAGVSDDGNWLIYDKDNNIIPIANGTDEDKTITGNGLPKLNASLTNNITWKNFDASISMRGAFGFELFDVHDFYYGLQTRQGNLSSNAFRRNAKITKGSNVISDYFIHKGDYGKIDAISIGYTLNTKYKFVEKVRLYGTANNLYTFTHFPGVDPSTYQVNGLTPGTFGEHVYDQVMSENYYQHRDDVIRAVLRPFEHAFWSETFKFECEESSGDQIITPSRDFSDWYDAGRWERFHSHAWTIDEGPCRISEPWGGWYTGIGQCNSVIEDLKHLTADQLGMSPEELEYFRLQLRALRAWYHYYLFDGYRNIIIYKSAGAEDVKSLSQADPKETFNWIEKECLECLDKLPAKTNGTGNGERQGQFNKAAIATLLVRLYLNAEIHRRSTLSGMYCNGQAHYQWRIWQL